MDCDIFTVMKISAIVACLVISLGVPAATIIAPGTDYTSVSNTVALASQGDIVQLPPGTNGWPRTLLISGITLIGSGTNSTLISNNVPINGSPLLQINTVSNFLTRLTAIHFISGVTNNISTFPGNSSGSIQISGSAPKWRIDHCQFELLTGKTIRINSDVYGLIDQNTFQTFDRIAVELFGNGYGDASWAQAVVYGGTNATYIENNYFTDGNLGGWCDSSQGGRLVYRYNHSDGYYLNTHGPETGGRERGSRYVECYMNLFDQSSRISQGNFQNYYTAVDIRGGSGVIFSNLFKGVNAGVVVRDYRSTDNTINYNPWWGATGLTNWDNNGPELANGFASGTTNVSYLTVAGNPWVPNQWVGCSVYNYQSNKCGTVSGSTSNTLTFDQNGFNNWRIGFKDGDQYSIHAIYPMLDGVGIGQSGLLSGDFPTPVYLNFQPQTLYNWKNIVLKTQTATNSLFQLQSNIVIQSASIFEGRQVSNAPAPGYVPFTYPFPTDPLVPAPGNSFTFGALKL